MEENSLWRMREYPWMDAVGRVCSLLACVRQIWRILSNCIFYFRSEDVGLIKGDKHIYALRSTFCYRNINYLPMVPRAF